jgi:hypothetical protein
MSIASGVVAQNSDIPPNILTYLKTAGTTEDGLPGGSEADAESFIAYFAKEWETVVTLLGTGLEDRKQALIFSAAEFLDPETYLSVTSEAIELFEDGKVTQGPLENLVSGQTRKDGFLFANADDGRIKRILLRAAEVLPDDSRVVTEIENALAGDLSHEISRQRAMSGMPPLESLDQEGSHKESADLQSREGSSSEASSVTSNESTGNRVDSEELDGGFESPTLPKWALAVIVVAAVGILLLLIQAFLRGRAS